MECSQKWLDVFVTNADPKQETDYDDRYVAPVQSVWVHSAPGVSKGITSISIEGTVQGISESGVPGPGIHSVAPHPIPGILIGTIVEEQTDWIMPTFPLSHETDPFKEIMVGDLIRVGAPSTSGFTDYLTVVEKQHIAAMANGTGVPLPLHEDGPVSYEPDDGAGIVHTWGNLAPYSANNDLLDGNGNVYHNTGLVGGRTYEMTALRVNHAVNCTSINRPKDDDLLKHFVTTPVAIRYYTSAEVLASKALIYEQKVQEQVALREALDAYLIEYYANDALVAEYQYEHVYIDWKAVDDVLGDPHSIDSTAFNTYFSTLPFSVDDYHPDSPHFKQANKASLTDRHLVHAWGPPKNVGEKPEYLPLYPMYHMREWRATYGQLTAELDHGVKEIQQFKLVGYSLINKRQVGPQHAHEMIQDDYLILRIKEVDGKVISNNRHANGAFAVLYAGAHGDNDKGGADVHKFDPDGLVVQHMSTTNKIMRNLTVQVTDRTGQPAHFGRLHLWFKILATHG